MLSGPTLCACVFDVMGATREMKVPRCNSTSPLRLPDDVTASLAGKGVVPGATGYFSNAIERGPASKLTSGLQNASSDTGYRCVVSWRYWNFLDFCARAQEL